LIPGHGYDLHNHRRTCRRVLVINYWLPWKPRRIVIFVQIQQIPGSRIHNNPRIIIVVVSVIPAREVDNGGCPTVLFLPKRSNFRSVFPMAKIRLPINSRSFLFNRSDGNGGVLERVHCAHRVPGGQCECT
jgi:hypothetical protein